MPKHACGTELRNFHKEVHANRKEERKATGEEINIESLGQRGADVFLAIGNREREFLNRGRSGFLHVVAGNRNRVELWHFIRRVIDDVGNDAHAWRRWIDVGVADHELFENVVLNGSGKKCPIDALLFTCDNKHGEDRNDGAIHGHRHAHLIERDFLEQDLHVFDRINRYAGLTDIANHIRVIRVVAAVCCEIECHRQAHLTGSEVASVERVRLFSG